MAAKATALLALLRMTLCHGEESYVYPKLLEGRSSGGPKLLQVREGIVLRLEPGTSVGDTLTLHSTGEDGKDTEEVVDGSVFRDHLYQDRDHMASITLYQLDSGILVRGMLSPTLRIEPTSVGPRSTDGQIAHRIYDASESLRKDALAAVVKARAASATQKETALPPNITLQVYVLVDPTITHKHDTFTKLAHYVIIFFNGVNLIFGAFKDPKIILEVARIKEARLRPEANWWTDDVQKGQQTPLDASKTLTNLASHVSKNEAVYSYSDIIYLMTGMDMSNGDTVIVRNKRGKSTRIGGLAMKGGVCTADKFAVGWDDGQVYYGIDVAGRLLARVLGAEYDGTGNRCPASEGNLMGNYNKDYYYYVFSRCSVNDIKNTLTARGQACWNRRYPVSYSWYDTNLPGTVVNWDMYCKVALDGFHKGTVRHCKDDTGYWAQFCLTSCCTDISWGAMAHDSVIAQDGRFCQKGKVCVGGLCKEAARS